MTMNLIGVVVSPSEAGIAFRTHIAPRGNHIDRSLLVTDLFCNSQMTANMQS